MTKPPLCKNEHPDGRVCALYLDHYGDHKENHLKSSWTSNVNEERLEEIRGIFERLIRQNSHIIAIDISVALEPYGLTKDLFIPYIEKQFPGVVYRAYITDTHLRFHVVKEGLTMNEKIEAGPVNAAMSGPKSPFAESVDTERQRQIDLGYTAEHDDKHGVDRLNSMARKYEEAGDFVKGTAMRRAAVECEQRRKARQP